VHSIGSSYKRKQVLLRDSKYKLIYFERIEAMYYYKKFLFTFSAIIFAFGACKEGNDLTSVERPKDPWIVRSILDNKPRMLSLALDTALYVAYDLQNLSLYKIWKGGINWTGAAYTNEKNIQPETWGHTYVKDSLSQTSWSIIKGEESYPAKAKFLGYQEKKNHLFLRYTIFDERGDTVQVSERPELVREGSKIGLNRNFSIKPNKPGLSLFQKSNSGEITLQVESVYQPEMYEEVGKISKPVKNGQYDHLGKFWLDRSGCNTCHEMDLKTIGPSYLQISGQYQENDDSYTQLIAKVKSGGSGIWGEVPMSPHPHLTSKEVRTMLSYIFTLNKEKTEKRPRKKAPINQAQPGFGAPLEALHPSLQLEEIRPRWFKPRVGGMDMDAQGRLYVSTWDSIGAVYRLTGIETGDSNQVRIEKIASGLHEPLGLKVVDEDIYVMQKSELSRLTDEDGDGIIDTYHSFCNSFHSSADFHEYNYGLVYKEGYFYANLGIAMRLLSTQIQDPDRGTHIRISKDGSFETLMTGLRQPNGIGIGPEDEIVITENQGRWVPACKLIVAKAGTFQGCKVGQGDRFDDVEVSPPAVWLPQDEIGNSPGEALRIREGLYKNHLMVGEVTHGGIKRIVLEKVAGEWQGVVFRFTQGLEAGINRMVYGPDGALYVGGVGMNGNWGWQGNRFGLQRLVSSKETAFEMFEVKAQKDGLFISFTEDISPQTPIKTEDLEIKQWRYEATENYGGPKLDLESLTIAEISQSNNGLRLKLPGLKEGYVVYIRLSDSIQSISNKKLWSGEAWYTLNHIPK